LTASGGKSAYNVGTTLSKHRVIWTAGLLVVAGVAALAAFRPIRISAGSMADTLRPGEFVLVQRYGLSAPQRGAVVTIRQPNNKSRHPIKRVVGVPGDVVEMRNKVLSVNGKPLMEPYVKHISELIDERRDNIAPVRVPPGKYYVLGDNRDNSLDSRNFGFVDADDIIGRPRLVYRDAAGWTLRKIR